LQTNVHKGTTKQTDMVVWRRTSVWSLVTSANKRDTMQIDALRKVLEDFSKLGQLKYAESTRRRHHKV
jgi:hypothetical protein